MCTRLLHRAGGVAQPGRPTHPEALVGVSHPRVAKAFANGGAHRIQAKVDASAMVVFLFVHADAGLPNALLNAAITSCLAHRCSLFGVLPPFQGRGYCIEGGVRSQCNPAVVPALPGPVLPFSISPNPHL